MIVTSSKEQEFLKKSFKYNSLGYHIISRRGNINEEEFNNLKLNFLRKSILFADRDDWSNEKIVSTYRSQHHVEECFKQMKDTEFLSFVPIRHFTDKHIIVHAFYYVLALTLASVLNLEFKRMGHEVSINQMLKELSSGQ
ncbi:MAG: hypothetical protein LBF22_12845 [Deltaproteobacteria bacterium]|jgi:transposase|nr:hypothetical protein [Deltaproteobacteria bacterium]